MWPALARVYGLSFDDVWNMPPWLLDVFLRDLALTIDTEPRG